MKLPGRGTLIANAALLALVLWLYVADVYDWARARTADVSALTELPRVGYASFILVATAISVGFFLYGIFKDRPPNFRGYRLLPIVAIVGLFVDLFVLSADELPMPPADQTMLVLHSLARSASERSTPEHVLVSDRELADLVKDFGQPPYLVKGKRAEAFTVQRRMDCDGPIKEAPGAQVGTFLYCVSKDQTRAWLTVVGLPVEQHFGVPAVITRQGEILGAVVEAETPSEEPGEEPGEQGGPELTGDAGSAAPVEGEDVSP
ncbi:MAG: hypothetical protein ACJ790_07010 [Myxococcaceae bacterium]